MNKSLLPISLILISLTAACSTKPPPDLIPKDKFINAMADLELNRAYFQATHDSVKADSIRTELLHHYGITIVQYLKSRKYYQQTGQEHEIIRKALDQLKHENDKVQNFINQKTDTTQHKKGTMPKDTTARPERHREHPVNQ